jgi:hydrogenase small subunit
MKMTRRDFLRWAGASATMLGYTALDLKNLEKALASADSPPVIWLQGAACSGCTISLFNSVDPTIDSVLSDTISMKYHPTLSTAAGDLAISTITSTETSNSGQFILVVEGGIPTANSGKYCIIGQKDGADWTAMDALKELGPKAKYVIAAGTCAAFTGIPGSGSNVTEIQTVSSVLSGLVSQVVINLPGCPVHPANVVGTLVDLINGTSLTLDSQNRPTSYYGTTRVHPQCPRHTDWTGASALGDDGCFWEFSCRGPETDNIATCPNLKWNNATNWCINTNVPCIGCCSPNFPYTTRLFSYTAESD